MRAADFGTITAAIGWQRKRKKNLVCLAAICIILGTLVRMRQCRSVIYYFRDILNRGNCPASIRQFEQERDWAVMEVSSRFCPDCGKQLLTAQRFCGNCGHRLESAALTGGVPFSGTGAPSGTSALDGLATQMSERLAQTLSRIEGRTSRFDSPRQAAIGLGSAGLSGGSSSGLIHNMEVVDLLTVSRHELDSAWQEVRHSPHIQTNEHHRPIAERTGFVFDEADCQVNAYASGGSGGTQPRITFLGGLANAFALISAAFGVHLALRQKGNVGVFISPVIPAFKEFSRVVCRSGKFDQESLRQAFMESVAPSASRAGSLDGGDFVARARTFRSSMCMAVIGHELGHIAYGHTQGKTLNFEISRDKEYDVDSFARQILSSCKAPEYTFVAQALVAVTFSWLDHVGGGGSPTTHPAGRDRFQEIFKDRDRRGQRIAENDFGLTYDELAKLLPLV